MEPIIIIPYFLNTRVLILIIMEDTHGAKRATWPTTLVLSLNPYYNGRYSWRIR